MAAAGATPATTSRGLRREAIVESLLADVFQGRLRAGQHLVTQELAERYAVSHTPIREALIALAGIGIITLSPNRGAVVKQVGAKEVREVCQVRKALECEAVRLACGRIAPAELQSLSTELKKLAARNGSTGRKQIAKAQELDNRLHDLIADASGNQFLKQELNRLKLLFRAFRDVAWEHDGAHNDFHRLNEEAHEHAVIVDGLLANDAKAAGRAMSQHIRSGMVYWSRALTAANKTLKNVE
jgi:DNA-binding GntR family transcriptional regulator